MQKRLPSLPPCNTMLFTSPKPYKVFSFEAESVLRGLKSSSASSNEFASVELQNTFRSALLGIFTNFTVELYVDPPNRFSFDGVSHCGTSVTSESCGTMSHRVLSAINVPGADLKLEDISAIALLEKSLCSYTQAISDTLNSCCSMPDGEPFLLATKFTTLLSLWEDFRLKLAATESLFEEMRLDTRALRERFLDVLRNDIVTEERADSIITALTSAISLKLLGNPHPSLTTLRRMVSFLECLSTRYVERLIEKTMVVITQRLHIQVSGLLDNEACCKGLGHAEVLRRICYTEEYTWASQLEGGDLLLEHPHSKSGQHLFAVCLRTINVINAYTEILSFLFQSVCVEIPSLIDEAFIIASQENTSIFIPSDECMLLMRAQSTLANLRVNLLDAFFDCIEPLYDRLEFQSFLIFGYFIAGKTLLGHLYTLAAELEASTKRHVTSLEMAINKSCEMALNIICAEPRMCPIVATLLNNSYLFTPDLKAYQANIPTMHILAFNLMYVQDVIEDFLQNNNKYVSDMLRGTIRKSLFNAINGCIYVRSNPTLCRQITLKEYCGAAAINHGDSFQSFLAEAVMAFIDSLVRYTCFVYLKCKAVDDAGITSSNGADLLQKLSQSGRTLPNGENHHPFHLTLEPLIYVSRNFLLAHVLACTLFTYLPDPDNILHSDKGGDVTHPSLPWTDILFGALPPQVVSSFETFGEVAEVLSRVTRILLHLCAPLIIDILDSNLLSRIVTLSLHRYLCFATVPILPLMEQTIYLKLIRLKKDNVNDDVCREFLRSITRASHIAESYRRISASHDNFLPLSQLLVNLFKNNTVVEEGAQEELALDDHVHQTILKLIQDNIRVRSSILQYSVFATNIPPIYVLSHHGQTVVCSQDVADILLSLPKDTDGSTKPPDLLKAMAEASILESIDPLRLNPLLLGEKGDRQYLGSAQLDFVCFYQTNSVRNATHLDWTKWYLSFDDLKDSMVDDVASISEAKKGNTCEKRRFFQHDAATNKALTNAYIVRLIKLGGPMTREAIVAHAIDDLEGVPEKELILQSLEYLIENEYLRQDFNGNVTYET
ncbi:hypothetical protein GMRT_15252 [Giardia muris]|uniref:Cullin neddylation domain-containing protein n=1 Tax=Giardia muris TaxID=5742 RepID=A0A4Z1SQR2_GIAMU|nr:hypothetical protein GMRT_15252 [Giardia muris]|eukprot:TNJ28176.1 hypothetical protein GMRT_15252 [Giardia muris]